MNDKLVFIDRDGVINRDPLGWTEHSYITSPEDIYFIPGSIDAIKKLTEAGYKSVVISNQQGVGKGYFSKEDLDRVTERVRKEVKAKGGSIEAFYYCLHREEEDCMCRKPKGGLFLTAKEELNIKDIDGKFYVGDTERDIIAGKTVGLKTILVLSGKSSEKDIQNWGNKPDHVCKDLLEAVGIILGEEKGTGGQGSGVKGQD